MIKWLFAFLGVIFLSASLAQDLSKYGVIDEELPVGVNVGDTIKNTELNLLTGETEYIYEYSKDRPTVILFYRGEWCPVCNKYLSNLSDSLDLIKEKANVIVISPETKENMMKTQEEHPEYTYVLDENEELMMAFDVVFYVTKKYQKKIKMFLRTDIAAHNENDDTEARLPIPATYIVNKDGVVLYRHFEYDYHIRASALDILKHL